MDFETKIKEVLNNEELTQVDEKVKAIIEAVGEFIPKGKFNELNKKYKDLEREKASLLEEFEDFKKSKMTEDEKKEAELKKFEQDKIELAKKLNEVKAREIFVNAGLNQEKINELLAKVVSEDSEKTLELANSFVEVFKEIKETTKKETITDLLKDTPQPVVNNSNGKEITKEDFIKMDYSEKKQLFIENPELFNKLSN